MTNHKLSWTSFSRTKCLKADYIVNYGRRLDAFWKSGVFVCNLKSLIFFLRKFSVLRNSVYLYVSDRVQWQWSWQKGLSYLCFRKCQTVFVIIIDTFCKTGIHGYIKRSYINKWNWIVYKYKQKGSLIYLQYKQKLVFQNIHIWLSVYVTLLCQKRQH